MTTLRGTGYELPEYESPVAGESTREENERRKRNRVARKWWDRIRSAQCAKCDKVRFHVSHEMDPEHSPEGVAYHAKFAHHAFVEALP